MARTSSGPRRRRRGRVETLPSGSLRVHVYAGLDTVTKKRYYLTETIPAGPKAAVAAEKEQLADNLAADELVLTDQERELLDQVGQQPARCLYWQQRNTASATG